jgi:hypothetical protein
LINALDENADDVNVQKQGLALLFYILSDHPYSRYSLKEARACAVMSGVVTTIQRAQRAFKDVEDVCNPCSCILKILVNELS